MNFLIIRSWNNNSTNENRLRNLSLCVVSEKTLQIKLTPNILFFPEHRLYIVKYHVLAGDLPSTCQCACTGDPGRPAGICR